MATGNGEAKAIAFLEAAEHDLVEACNRVSTASPDVAPPPPPEDIAVNGFTPISGDGCVTGYVELGTPDHPVADTVTNPVVRSEPTKTARTIGYLVPDRPGWVALESIRVSGLSLAQLNAASAAIRREHLAARSAQG